MILKYHLCLMHSRTADYVSFTPTLKVTIPPDSNRSCFTGQVIEDQIALEGTEDFILQLQDSLTTGLIVGDNDQTIVEIIDTNGEGVTQQLKQDVGVA